MNESRDPILAGVDGTEAGLAAVRYAAAEAARSGAALHLVHVVELVVPPMATWPVTPTDPDSMLQEHGGAVLAAAKEAVAHTGAVVSTQLLLGRPATVIAQEAANARLVVLGDQPRGLIDRIITSSVLAPVAAHSPVPVIAVPAGWQDEGAPREIVVGIQDAVTSVALVRRGLEVAAARGARLRLLHAWHAYGAYQDYLTVGAEERQWTERAERDLTAAMEAARADSSPEIAGVEVQVDVRHSQAAYALVEASRTAELLILGRGRNFLDFGHLGGTSRAVLRESVCPVEVDPHVAPAFEGDAGAAVAAGRVEDGLTGVSRR